MKKSLLLIPLVLVALAALYYLTRGKPETSRSPAPTATPALNTIPLEERPFMTLTPDGTGRSLVMTVQGAPRTGDLEYELVYNALDKQEGVFGRLDLSSESQPIVKSLLLGSKSGGGKVTYHEGVTGGSMTASYDSIRLKEQWNFLHFDPSSPTITSPDARFSATLDKRALAKDQAVIVMKPFGLPAKVSGSVKAGPYTVQAVTDPKGKLSIELKLPAGEYSDPKILAFDGKTWVPLSTTVVGDTLTATAENASVYIAVAN